ncbi:hypothetical protein LCGC14_1421410 [marine sediment metagenome]|uniref:Uncharacterized protein n=1 Tax=marine sediment metagenome TaxID=412755 RepID=A0A0F9MSZ2_9ZZZZ
MPRFHCKHCGIISDGPEIVPHPDKDAEYREIAESIRPLYSKAKGHCFFSALVIEMKETQLAGRYNHSITCPICLNETRFWRESPFPLAPLPTDGRINLDGSPFSLSVKAMLSDMNL